LDDLNYWAIAERDIEIQNPVTDRKLRLLDDYCDIRDGLSILDIGCGKAWVLRQWADKFAIEGVGVDINPRFTEVAQRRPPSRGRLTFHTRPMAGFTVTPGSYDVVLCLGSSQAIGDIPAAVDWMVEAAKPGGSVVLGTVTLKHQPEVPKGEILPLDVTQVIGVIERHGAEVSATISASEADYERYASHHRHATLAWARANPTHPDHAEVLERSRSNWMVYLKTVRPLLGFTVFVGRKQG
jgi:cyclopropane fatty-acyl-phospholipid synthase-like methyltransferase